MKVRRLLLVFCLSLGGIGPAMAVEAQAAGGSRADGLEQCVESTDFMRRNHMEVLLHQRDQTVHQGIRTKQHSLAECVSCHAEKDADGKFVSINGAGQFCQGCHATAAVSIDCFQCHAARPEASARSMPSPSLALLSAYCIP